MYVKPRQDQAVPRAVVVEASSIRAKSSRN